MLNIIQILPVNLEKDYKTVFYVAIYGILAHIIMPGIALVEYHLNTLSNIITLLPVDLEMSTLKFSKRPYMDFLHTRWRPCI